MIPRPAGKHARHCTTTASLFTIPYTINFTNTYLSPELLFENENAVAEMDPHALQEAKTK